MNLARLDPQFLPNLDRGTHSWGTRSSSSTPNAWGSSTLSPNTDGGSGSPSHLSGRPSSGGSGSRPSTASSDRTHESITNAWGSNSRPSSASGALTSNQTSPVPLRPRSAETRPGSSQLSRFAEPLSDNSVAWGTTGTAEKLVWFSERSLLKSSLIIMNIWHVLMLVGEVCAFHFWHPFLFIADLCIGGLFSPNLPFQTIAETKIVIGK